MNERGPTDEGVRRYPPDGYYEDYPCRCRTTCPQDCKGVGCACPACHVVYQDFLSERE